MRTSVLDGTNWYAPAVNEDYQPGQLAQTIDGFLARADYFATDDQLVALIAPHAGYPYSGQTAAFAYRQLKPGQFDTVVLLGPSHHEDFGAVAVNAKQFYATPLGNIKLDSDWIDALAQTINLARVPRDREHSLEIQLPFLQRALGDFKLVPLMLSVPFYIAGADALPVCEQLSAALAAQARGRRVLFVASSDLSHLADYNAVKKFDARTETLLATFDLPSLADYMARDYECRACGDAPIITALLAAQTLGADRARILHRTNSGDVTGERERAKYVVGYMSVGIYASKK